MRTIVLIGLLARYFVKRVRAYEKLLISLWHDQHAGLQIQAYTFLETLLAQVMGHEVKYDIHFKAAGPEPRPERFKQETRNHPAFERSRVYEFSFTVFRPPEDCEIPPAGRIETPGS